MTTIVHEQGYKVNFHVPMYVHECWAQTTGVAYVPT